MPIKDLLDHLLSTTASDTSARTVEVSGKVYAELQSSSIEVGRHIWGAGRFASTPGENDEWKQELSFLDVERITSELDLLLKKKGLDVKVVVK